MLKFRRTRFSPNDSTSFGKRQGELPSKPPKHGLSGRMKKSAPPPPGPQSGASVLPHKVAVISHNPDDSAINELLEGRMELEVVLPGNKTVKMTIERRMPMMDLLIQVTSANKINPGGHVIHVVTERGNDIIHYKPSTPIGSLDTNTIHVVPKSSVIIPPVKKFPKVVNQPFEQTFRLQVNLPRNQLAVLRVSPKSTLADIHRMTCEEKSLDPSKYDLRHPNHLEEPLDRNVRLSEYGMNEVTLVSSYRSTNGSIHGSTSDILALRTKDDEKKKKGIFHSLAFHWKRRSKVSLDSQGEDPNSRGVSPTRSDSSGGGYTSSDARSTSPNRPISYHEGMSVSARTSRQMPHSKKRPAPPPPPLPSTSTSQQKSAGVPESSESIQGTTTEKIPDKNTMPIVSHSRHSSDSSGYHEASVLSDALDSIPTTQSSSPTTSLETEPPVQRQNLINEVATTPSILSRPKSMSCSNVSVATTTAIKKRRAPAPPAVPSASRTVEDIPAELNAAIEQIEECSRLNQSDVVQETTDADQEYREFVFSTNTSVNRTDSGQDNIDGEDKASVRTYSLSSQDTLNEIEASFEQTIIAAENMIRQEDRRDAILNSDETEIRKSPEPKIYEHPEPVESKPEEKKIFQETRTEDAPSNVTEPEKTFFEAVDEISNTSVEKLKSRSESETFNSSANRCATVSSDIETELKEHNLSLIESNSDGSDQHLDELTKSESFSSENSIDSQIHIPSAPPLPQQKEEFVQSYQEVSEVKNNEGSVSKVEVSSAISNFQNQSYESETLMRENISETEREKTKIDTEISESFRSPKVLSNHFSSMQDLHKSSLNNEKASSNLHEDVESTMRKVQSEINLMVSQRNRDDNQVKEQEELQNQYKNLQEQFLIWQKQLAENQSLLSSEHKALFEQSSVTIDDHKSEPQGRAETLPRVSKKQEPPAKPRPIRDRPSVVIASWSDQKNAVHKEYKTEIKIQSEEIEEQKKQEARMVRLGATKPSFRISHSKIDTDIFYTSPNDGSKSSVKSPVRAPVVPMKLKPTTRSYSEESPSQQQNIAKRKPERVLSVPSPQRVDKPRPAFGFTTWSKLEINENQPLPVFRRRGVTTNNKGELVVKESRSQNSSYKGQNQAIQDAKNQVMEQVKNKVRERSEGEESSDSHNGSINCSPAFGRANRAKTLPKENLMESNNVIKAREIGIPTNRYESKNYIANGNVLANGNNVYIDNIKNLSERRGEKENVLNSNIPLPPTPPALVPNLTNKKTVNNSPPVIVNKRKPRKIIEPKLDAREELMLAIRNFGGRTTLRKV